MIQKVEEGKNVQLFFQEVCPQGANAFQVFDRTG